MATTELQQFFFHAQVGRAGTGEFKTFLSCNDKIGKILRWTHKSDGSSTEELRQLAFSQGGLFNGEHQKMIVDICALISAPSLYEFANFNSLDFPVIHFKLIASMRQKAWPALLEIKDMEAVKSLLKTHKEILHMGQHASNHDSDLDIIRKDVQRSSMFRCQSVSGSIVKGEQQSDALQEKLISVIYTAVSTPTAVGEEKPSYYQGLHDIAFVLLFNLNYDEVTTVVVLRKLLQTHLQDAARKDFGNVLFLLNAVLMPFLQSIDPQVYQALIESDVPISNAIMPWLITLFAHPVHDQAVASRLMDAFVTSHPLLPFYVAVALLVHPSLRTSILEAAYDPCMMHMTVHGLPGQMKNDFEVPINDDQELITAQVIIDTAMQLMRQHPPESLLHLVGKGLTGKSQRRVLTKARSISVLGLPPLEDTSLRLRIKHILATRNLSSREMRTKLNNMTIQVQAMYHFARNEASRAATVSNHSFMVLQVVFLFILMPQHYAKDFCQVVRSISHFCSRVSRLPDGYSTKTLDGNAKSGIRADISLGSNENDLPGMIKSNSTLSMPELDIV